MCHSNIADLPCHSRIILFLFDLTDCSIGKTFFSISFPHLLRNIERFSERTLQICRAVFLLPARSEHISQTRKSQPAEHLFLIHSTKKCTPARYFLVHQYAKTVFQWHPLEVGVFLLEEDTTKNPVWFCTGQDFFRRTASPVPARTAGFRLRGSAFLRLRCSPILLQSVRTPVC